MAKRKRRKFTPEFKREVVELCRRGDRSIGQVARDLDLMETSVRHWVKQAEVDDGSGPENALTTEEKEELRRLRKENRVLREEREILKKCGGLLREGEQVKFGFIHAEKVNHAVRMMCRVLGVSHSGYEDIEKQAFTAEDALGTAAPVSGREFDRVERDVEARMDRWFADRDVLVPPSGYDSDGYVVQLGIKGIAKRNIDRVDVVIDRRESASGGRAGSP